MPVSVIARDLELLTSFAKSTQPSEDYCLKW